MSEDLLENQFVCDLNACKGACCVEGDTGAPLDPDELGILDRIYPQVAPYLSEESRNTIAQKGTATFIRETGKHATTLNADGACAFVIRENGIAFCGIEKAWKEGKVDFQKPVSCHLYPVRITRYQGFEAANYERWNICKAACKHGKALKVQVFRFVKTALDLKYGPEFSEILEAYYLRKKGED